ncbi:MAG: hypothetical protein CMO07_18950 [Thalassospira sp.]|nr:MULTISPECIES: DUF2474 family protein [unclassified Thalassospira]MBE72740.1 hypothetical protein [Thalassospira sp.]QPO12996.1 DUF2474 family protein [Thalassospira sp. A40-3]|tara:strand:- start:73 stop:207 length:135 start_codon:yes stop_codon:yes gene_type:complete
MTSIKSPVKSPKARRWLWFVGLYVGGVVVLGAASLLLRALMGQA